ALKRAIAGARHHVHVQFFIVRDDEYGRDLRASLVAAAERGVQVRMLTDRVGSRALASGFFAPLIAAGGQFYLFKTLTPLKNRFSLNLRNHRKLQIIDARTAFVGGMNLGREYAGKDPSIGGWHDIQMQLQGDVTASLQDVFANDWHFASGEKITEREYYQRHGEDGTYLAQAITGGPDLPQEPMPKSIVMLLLAATKRVWLTTGYFVPDTLLLNALQICAARGTEVRLLVSEKSDHPFLVRIGRSFYEELLESGVRIFEYAKWMNHGKVMAIDGEWLMVGSANFDNRSMRLNFELNVLAKHPARTAELEEVLLGYFADSNEVHLAQVKARPFQQRMIEAALRPLSPLM
nr:phospholipase D-like domain-containing protein [Verrucomicrobiota bacterium]